MQRRPAPCAISSRLNLTPATGANVLFGFKSKSKLTASDSPCCEQRGNYKAGTFAVDPGH
jgi:hypothetical protein